MLSEVSFKSINTKEKFDKKFPDMRFLSDTNFPDFSKLSKDQDSLVQHLVVYASLILNKSASFHDHMQKLIMNKLFMGCPLLSILERTSRFKIRWSTSSNMLTAMGISLKGLLKYLEGLKSNILNRLEDSFKYNNCMETSYHIAT